MHPPHISARHTPKKRRDVLPDANEDGIDAVAAALDLRVQHKTGAALSQRDCLVSRKASKGFSADFASGGPVLRLLRLRDNQEGRKHTRFSEELNRSSFCAMFRWSLRVFGPC